MSEETATQTVVTEVKTNDTAKQKISTSKIVLISVGIVLILIGGIVLLANTATQGAVTASNSLVNAAQAGDTTTTYGLLSKEAKETISQDDLGQIVTQIGPILNTTEKMTGKEVSAETGKASSGKVTYEIVGTDGNTYAFEVNLIKEDDAWKVLNFDSNLKE